GAGGARRSGDGRRQLVDPWRGDRRAQAAQGITERGTPDYQSDRPGVRPGANGGGGNGGRVVARGRSCRRPGLSGWLSRQLPSPASRTSRREAVERLI